MSERPSQKILGWFFLGVGAWSVISVCLDRWLYLNKNLDIMTASYFSRQYANIRTFSDFLPSVFILSIFSLLAGIGFLRKKPWAKLFSFLYLFSAAGVGLILCFRYSQKFRDNWIWVSWFVGIAFLGLLAYFIKRIETTVSVQKSSLEAYEEIHWKLINSVARLFGIVSLIVGGSIGFWGIRLFFQPHVSSFPGDISTDLISKLIITFISLFFIIIGILCLLAKPIATRNNK